jgi:hypothetical protein
VPIGVCPRRDRHGPARLSDLRARPGSVRHDPLVEAADLSCPKCDGPMEWGHLGARFPGIRWTTGRRAFTGLGEASQRRVTRTLGFFRQAAVPARRCGRCRIIVFIEEGWEGGASSASQWSAEGGSAGSWWAGRT